MVEHRIKQHWGDIALAPVSCRWTCRDVRSIFDFGFKVEERIVGIDVKTKDLDSTKYSDGGSSARSAICSSFSLTTEGHFIIAEFGH